MNPQTTQRIATALAGSPQEPLFGENMTKASIDGKRKIAESLISQATEYQPSAHWATAIAKALQGAVGGYQAAQADKADAARHSAIVNALKTSSSPDALDLLSVQAEDPQIASIANARRAASEHAADNARQDSQFNQQMGLRRQEFEAENAARNRPDYAFDASTGQFYDTHNPQAGMKPMPGYSPTPAYRPPTPEELKQYPGANYITKEGPHYPPKSAVTINNGELGADETTYKNMAEKEAKNFADIDQQGIVASGMNQDLQVLDELLQQAPQGPIQGRLINALPGFSSAGDAANAIIKRVAPSLRTAGSGSQSDVEYAGFLQSMPQLQGLPQGNKLISDTLKAKTRVDIERF
jgi:hypothetical protein